MSIERERVFPRYVHLTCMSEKNIIRITYKATGFIKINTRSIKFPEIKIKLKQIRSCKALNKETQNTRYGAWKK